MEVKVVFNPLFRKLNFHRRKLFPQNCVKLLKNILSTFSSLVGTWMVKRSKRVCGKIVSSGRGPCTKRRKLS